MNAPKFNGFLPVALAATRCMQHALQQYLDAYAVFLCQRSLLKIILAPVECLVQLADLIVAECCVVRLRSFAHWLTKSKNSVKNFQENLLLQALILFYMRCVLLVLLYVWLFLWQPFLRLFLLPLACSCEFGSIAGWLLAVISSMLLQRMSMLC